MSVINGRVVGFDDREFTLHTGSDGEAGGGKIYPVDPAAVAHFKAVLAEREATKRPSARRVTGIKRASTGLDNDLQRKVNAAAERVAAKKAAAAAVGGEAATAEAPVSVKKNEDEETMNNQKLTSEQVVALHGRYMAGENIRVLATEAGIPWQRLSGIFRQEGLPPRPYLGKGGNVSHKRGPKSRNAATPRKSPAPKTAVVPAPTAVVPAQETAVATNGPMQTGDLRQQLTLIQELLGLAEAQSVTLHGKISVELHAEVAF